MIRLLLVLALALVLAGAPARAEQTVRIGYLGWKKDPAYDKSHLRRRLPMQAGGRPVEGAALAVKDARFALAAVGLALELDKTLLRKREQLGEAFERMRDEGIAFFLLDLPAEMVIELRDRSAGAPVLLFNVSALEDSLRTTECAPHLLHTAPSHRMLGDALGQFLTARKWRELLVLAGTEPADAPWIASFAASADRYGLDIVEQRDFVLGKDPRQRNQNNVALLTKGDYEAVVVLEARGEFAAAVPYSTLLPRPVLGAAGLSPLWWHWSWERHGAPQLQSRFFKLAERDMSGPDWAAWVAVKALVQVIQRSQSSDFKTLREALLSPALEVDAFKGTRVNFRPWNGQLRQNLLLSDGQWVIARAPLPGFLHPSEDLDTLGATEREVSCR